LRQKNDSRMAGQYCNAGFPGKGTGIKTSHYRKDFEIDQLKKLVARLEEDSTALDGQVVMLKDEVKRLRYQYRNFKARVTPPKEPNA
jgi:predicted RNase H-like nuclease (RuvC/YqgF family)